MSEFSGGTTYDGKMDLTDWDVLRAISTGIALLTFLIMTYQAVRRWRSVYTWKVRIIWLSTIFASVAFGNTAAREIRLEAEGGPTDLIRFCALLLLLITAVAPIDDGPVQEFPILAKRKK